MTAKKTRKLLTSADLRESGKKLTELEVKDGEDVLGVVFVRQIPASVILDYKENTDNKEGTVDLIHVGIADHEGNALFADKAEIRELPLALFGALSKAVNEQLKVLQGGEDKGNASGEAVTAASPTA
jgi:hypothetical protein